jgi:glycosyltransferase involved in cell wall biosynthesis
MNVVKTLDPDILHLHVWRHPYVFQLSKINSVRILQPHSPFYSLKQLGIITYIYYTLVDNFLGHFIKEYNLIAITPLERDILYKKFRASSELIPNGVDDELFSKKSEGDEFYLYIGRISKEKNIMKMLKAYKISNIKRQLLLAGPDNGILKEILAYTSNNNLNIKYLGEISEDKKRELLRKCRALVNPSPFEGFGLTLVEAEAIGKPTIIVGRGGQEFVAPPEIASLRAEDNEKSIAQAFENMEDESVYYALSKGAMKYAENFKMSTILPK